MCRVGMQEFEANEIHKARLGKGFKDNMKTIRDFFSKRFTSIRFSWSFFSLFMSIGTFSLVLTDRLPNVKFIDAIILCGIALVVFSLIVDFTGVRQNINKSESMSNPKMIELMQDVKEIKAKMRCE